MSKSKEVIGSTPQSSSGENTEVLERPSSLSARTDNTQTFMQTTNQPLAPMLSGEITTPPTTDKALQHSVIVKAALSYLLKAGLVKRFKVLSPDGATVQKIRYEFDLSVWTQDLDLK